MSQDAAQAELILYYSPNCSSCNKVLHFLNDRKITVSLKNITLDTQSKEELLHIGGKVQVPCLFIDGTPLYDSQDIIDWLIQHTS
jgi:glutathione S-transferase